MTIQSKTTLKTYFNTGDMPTESNFADLIDSYDDNGTGAAQVAAHDSSTTAHANIREAIGYNVKDYGAVGDGATDDTTAIQNTITAAEAGGTVLFPSGTYPLTSTIFVRKPLNLVGEPGTTLRFNTTATPSQVAIWYQSAMDSNSADAPYYGPLGGVTYYRTFSGSVNAGASVFGLASTTGLSASTDCMLLLGADPYDATQPYLRMFNRVTSLSGSTVTFDVPVPEDISGSSHKCVTFDDIVENCGVQNITIECDSAFSCDGGLWFDKTRNCYARHVVFNRWRHTTFIVEASENTTLENIYAYRIEPVGAFAGSLVGGWGFRNLLVRNAFLFNGAGAHTYVESQGRNALFENCFCQRSSDATATASWTFLGHTVGVHLSGFHHSSARSNGNIVLNDSEGSIVSTRDAYLYDGTFSFPLVQHSGKLVFNGKTYTNLKHWSKEFALFTGRPLDIGLPSGVYKDFKVYVPNSSNITYFNMISGAGDISGDLTSGCLVRPAAASQITYVGDSTNYPFNDTEAKSTQLTTASNTPVDSYGVMEIEYYAPQNDNTQGFVQAQETLNGIYRLGLKDQSSGSSGQIITAGLSASRLWTMPNVSGTVLTQDDTGRTAPTILAAGNIFVNGADEASIKLLNIKQAASPVAIFLSDYVSGSPKQASVGFNPGLTAFFVDVIQQGVGYMPIELNPNGGDVKVGNSGGKIGMYGASAVAQPASSGASAVFVSNAGSTVNTSSTFDGYTLQQIARALKNMGILG